MLGVKIICVGKLKEKYLLDACSEYLKRLSAFCKAEVEELEEAKLPDNPSNKEIEAALLKEAEAIGAKIPPKAYVIALCVEGKGLSSEAFAAKMNEIQNSGFSKLCFVIGGSNGLSETVKKSASFCLSVSEMTFPHHLFRVMLLEQVYRAFMINQTKGKYHK